MKRGKWAPCLITHVQQLASSGATRKQVSACRIFHLGLNAVLAKAAVAVMPEPNLREKGLHRLRNARLQPCRAYRFAHHGQACRTRGGERLCVQVDACEAGSAWVYAGLLLSLYTVVVGEFAVVDPTLGRLIGRKPIKLRRVVEAFSSRGSLAAGLSQQQEQDAPGPLRDPGPGTLFRESVDCDKLTPGVDLEYFATTLAWAIFDHASGWARMKNRRPAERMARTIDCS